MPPPTAISTGFDVLVGGGLGRTANKPNTWPAVAQALAHVQPRDVVEAARAVVAVQRDHGDRADRRHARLKYLIADRGIDWFRDQVASRVSFTLEPSRSLHWGPVDDHLGWLEQGDGNHCYGLFVENGRIDDTELGRTAIRAARGRRDIASGAEAHAPAERPVHQSHGPGPEHPDGNP